jgi:hypothetical protein
MSPTTAQKRDDIRKLAKIDKRHGFLATADPGWYDRRAHTILVERARDGVPLVGVMLRYPFECPADKTATMWIQYWLANLDRKDELDAAFKASVQAIHDEMVAVGAQRVWGPVPMNAAHLTSRLNPIAVAGKCETAAVEGARGRKVYFFGDRDTVNTEVQGIA